MHQFVIHEMNGWISQHHSAYTCVECMALMSGYLVQHHIWLSSCRKASDTTATSMVGTAKDGWIVVFALTGHV